MNNLIATIAWLCIPVSIWAIIYFTARIVTHSRIRKELGDMPSADEIHAMYERNNAIIEYREHSPIEQTRNMQ
jgi:hypothetical protein